MYHVFNCETGILLEYILFVKTSFCIQETVQVLFHFTFIYLKLLKYMHSSQLMTFSQYLVVHVTWINTL